jgi:Ulp1 family protease
VDIPAKRTRAVSLQDSDEEEAIPKKQPRLAPKPKPKLPQRWSRPLLYPYDGPRRQNVDWEDLKRLLPEEFLNDNIINFYIRFVR